jgi:hypothetical protein
LQWPSEAEQVLEYLSAHWKGDTCSPAETKKRLERKDLVRVLQRRTYDRGGRVLEGLPRNAETRSKDSVGRDSRATMGNKGQDCGQAAS